MLVLPAAMLAQRWPPRGPGSAAADPWLPPVPDAAPTRGTAGTLVLPLLAHGTETLIEQESHGWLSRPARLGSAAGTPPPDGDAPRPSTAATPGRMRAAFATATMAESPRPVIGLLWHHPLA